MDEKTAPTKKTPRVHVKRTIPVNDESGPASLALMLFFAAAAVLPRVWGLGTRSYSVAEANLLLQASEPYKQIIQLIAWGGERYAQYNIKYALVVKLWACIGGTGELWTRSFSVLAGLAGIFFAYLAARVVYEKKPALLSALLTAICPFHVIYSRTVGYESLLFALCAASTYFFLKIYTGKAKASAYFFYFAAMLAAMNLHYLAALLFVSFNFVLLTHRDKSKESIYPWITANAPLAAIFLLWAPAWRILVFSSWKPEIQVLEFYHPGLLTPTLTIFAAIAETYCKFFFTSAHFFTGELLTVFSIPGFFLMLVIFHIAFFLGFREFPGGLRLRYFCFMTLGFAGCGAAFICYSGVPLETALIPVWPVFNMIIAGGVSRYGGARLQKAFNVTLALLLLGGFKSIAAREVIAPDWKALVSKMEKFNKSKATVFILDGWESSSYVFYSGSNARENVVALFPDFAPVMLENGAFLQDEIVKPYSGYFDAYQDVIEKHVRTGREAWILYREITMRNTPRIGTELNWVASMTQSGVARTESFVFPDDAALYKLLRDDGTKMQQITATRIILNPRRPLR